MIVTVRFRIDCDGSNGTRLVKIEYDNIKYNKLMKKEEKRIPCACPCSQNQAIWLLLEGILSIWIFFKGERGFRTLMRLISRESDAYIGGGGGGWGREIEDSSICCVCSERERAQMTNLVSNQQQQKKKKSSR
jgi:hypothetical protein